MSGIRDVGLLGVVLFFVAEVVAEAAWQRRLVLALAPLCTVGAGLLSTRRLPGFEWLEPFQGGEDHLALASVAWFLLGLTSGASLVYAVGGDAFPRGVSALGLGGGSFFGLGCLLFAGWEFDPAWRRTVQPHYEAKGLGAVPTWAASATASGLLASCEGGASEDRALGAVGLALFAAAYSQLRARLRVHGYYFFQPLKGGPPFVVLQAEAWLTFGGVLAVAWHAAHTKKLVLPRGGFVFVACAQLGTNALIELSPLVFDPERQSTKKAIVVRAIKKHRSSHKKAAPTTTPTARRIGGRGSGSGERRKQRGRSSKWWSWSSSLLSSPPRARVVWQYALWLAAAVVVVGSMAGLYASRDGNDDGARERTRLCLVALFTAPLLCHAASAATNDHFFYDPLRGGFEFVVTQSYGWIMYSIAVLVALLSKLNLADFSLRSDHVVPLLFFATVLISASSVLFDGKKTTVDPHYGQHRAPSSSSLLLSKVVVPPEGGKKPRGLMQKRKGSRLKEDRGGSSPRRPTVLEDEDLTLVGRVEVRFGAVCAFGTLVAVGCYAVGLFDSRVRCGATIMGGALLATVAGFHCVWTHLWLLMAACAMLMENEALLAAFAVLGLNISVVWYATLYRQRHFRLPNRAVRGWTRWLYDELFGLGDVALARMSWRPIQSIYSGFALLDLGLHLLPTLILLRLAAHRIRADSVLAAYAASRLWSLAVTTHHFRIDLTTLRHGASVIVLERHAQRPSCYATFGAPNQIYGFTPPAPPAFFQHAAKVEILTTASVLAVVLVAPTETKTAIFNHLGGSALCSVDAIIGAAALCCVGGGVTIAVGAVIAWLITGGS